MERIRSAVVRINNVAQKPSYYSPWQDYGCISSTGSGFIIEGQRILTNAHLVSDSKYLEVIKEKSEIPYRAVVSFIGHDCDLAILDVQDKSFFKDTTYLEFGKNLPGLQSTVLVYGFPMGGQRISVTRGVVSRIDYAVYIHPGNYTHLIMQIDAALNPGNSGGPVIQDGRVAGVAFQFGENLQNVGYAVPLTVIGHFLADIADGTYDGYPDVPLSCQNLINGAYRRYLGLKEGMTGVVVSTVIERGSAEGFILPRDVLVAVDGRPISDDGSITVGGESYSLGETIERKQVGEPVKFDVIRSGRLVYCTFPLKKLNAPMVRGNTYDKKPEYFIFGGLIFQPLSLEYLKTWSEDWWNNADKRLLYYFDCYFSNGIYIKNPEPIVLTRVLPAPVNRHYTGMTNNVVKKVNGREVKSLRDVIDAFEAARGTYYMVEFDGPHAPCVLDANQVKTENAEILRTYGIPRDRCLHGDSSGDHP